jgi:hypothetical protein
LEADKDPKEKKKKQKKKRLLKSVFQINVIFFLLLTKVFLAKRNPTARP